MYPCQQAAWDTTIVHMQEHMPAPAPCYHANRIAAAQVTTSLKMTPSSHYQLHLCFQNFPSCSHACMLSNYPPWTERLIREVSGNGWQGKTYRMRLAQKFKQPFFDLPPTLQSNGVSQHLHLLHFLWLTNSRYQKSEPWSLQIGPGEYLMSCWRRPAGIQQVTSHTAITKNHPNINNQQYPVSGRFKK